MVSEGEGVAEVVSRGLLQTHQAGSAHGVVLPNGLNMMPMLYCKFGQ